MSENTLERRVALVTGAGSGIGRAIALALGRRGARVHLVGRRAVRLDEVAGLLPAGAATTHALDIVAPDAAETLAERVRRDPGRLDILVHSAGTFERGSMLDTPVESMDRQWQVNTRAAYTVTRPLLPLLVDGQGDVVFVNSSAACHPRAGVGGYTATKLALAGLADSLRAEVNPAGVRVLSIFPGRTDTPMQERIMAEEGRTRDPDRLLAADDVAEAVIAAVSMPRSAEITSIHIRPMRDS